jgi:hypothetical protein
MLPTPLDELGHERGDRGLVESGLRREIRTGATPFGAHLAQHEPEVVGPHVGEVGAFGPDPRFLADSPGRLRRYAHRHVFLLCMSRPILIDRDNRFSGGP